ncbi:PREDICTED: heparan-sulfate 6-O-sulfotransferase 3-like [Amphimedon queenslandica]|uniref:Heparan-sulfate 6-O-sulfotransferase n=1 Tax=Amphimedon queenslandica TaxID=400682 RepID=A0A1X7VFE9_AMPQE|nr:PREDICTED: heparan-sulfate 6-O-sulfotransferase 3-like [Amphimedon queenslandica]|eukprot:XP_019849094.1 PREDICTED: heparan-sulfate 6-O-sulfotransferase 3-like [Amphimedon queenslandica]
MNINDAFCGWGHAFKMAIRKRFRTIVIFVLLFFVIFSFVLLHNWELSSEKQGLVTERVSKNILRTNSWSSSGSPPSTTFLRHNGSNLLIASNTGKRIEAMNLLPWNITIEGSTDKATVTPAGKWNRLKIDWLKGNDVLVFMHIQRTGGKSFLYYTGSVTQRNKSLCSYEIQSNVTISGGIPKSWRLLCPITDAAYYPNSNTTPVKLWPTTKPLSLKALKKLKLDFTNMKPLPEMWLLSEVTYQWPCGIHSFLTAMTPCVRNIYTKRYGEKERRFHYFTLLRDPLERYLSEFLYTYEGRASWDVVTGVKDCPGAISEYTVPECYHNAYKRHQWPNVNLSSFVSCPHNWAHNRQTWMLADLKDLQCNGRKYKDRESFERELLASAKSNLRSMPFFGLTEYMRESALLFEYRFNVKFKLLPPFKSSPSTSKWLVESVTNEENLLDNVLSRNELDKDLYKYALSLFKERLKIIGINKIRGRKSRKSRRYYMNRKSRKFNYHHA